MKDSKLRALVDRLHQQSGEEGEALGRSTT
jgi:hypothetical protein